MQTKMKFPFHEVEICGDVLFAARGGTILSFKLSDGSHLSSWQYPLDDKQAQQIASKLVINVSENSTPAPPSQDEAQCPPAKRVKLDNGDSHREEALLGEAEKQAEGHKPEDDSQNQETVIIENNVKAGNGVRSAENMKTDQPAAQDTPGKGKKNKKQGKPQPQLSERPMVIILTATKDNSHLVAVTSDKSVWVFEHDGLGHLKQLSRRTMPKRPCSIVLTPDTNDILSADKFGDVYQLPLIHTEDATTSDFLPQAENSPSPSPAPGPEPFKPSASELTVHTRRNRQALLDQHISRLKNRGGTPRKPTLVFERHLLLGHVSLLTDITLGFDESGQKPYIITADRDEHIRVSRGTREMAHVIEAYCLGHEEFVNRILVPESSPLMGKLLVSGGGDNSLFVWQWKEGKLLGKTDLLGRVRDVVSDAEKLAVTGLWCWSAESKEELQIVVMCEQVPALFLYTLKEAGSLDFTNTIKLTGNPLHVGVVDDGMLVVAVDASQYASDCDPMKSLLKVEQADGGYQISHILVQGIPEVGEISVDLPGVEIQKLLYNAETLRKLDLEEGGPDGE